MITLKYNNLETTEGNTKPCSGEMLSSPSESHIKDDNMKTQVHFNKNETSIIVSILVQKMGASVKETEDSFDKITVSRNMKELKSYSDQFHKVAKEAHTLQQRMEGLYEDMGKVLGRYYEINELDEGGKGSGRKAKPGGAKDIENRMSAAVDDANARLDAAEKAAKKK